MKHFLLRILKATGAWNYKKGKARFLHPVGFLFFIILIPILAIVCIFIDEGLPRAIKGNYTLV